MGKVETQGDDISTHSLTRRLTLGNQGYSISAHHFNSQPHEEADKKAGMTISSGLISTHSLTRRLTEVLPPLRCPIIFQLTASRGG